jgi:hypothetical protein
MKHESKDDSTHYKHIFSVEDFDRVVTDEIGKDLHVIYKYCQRRACVDRWHIDNESRTQRVAINQCALRIDELCASFFCPTTVCVYRSLLVAHVAKKKKLFSPDKFEKIFFWGHASS